MKLSTRSKYGMRAMIALAMQQGSRPFMVKDIAEQEGLPATYLEQLMVLLRKAGLVTAMRGAHGGYLLARPASAISIEEIMTVLEGPIDLAECSSGGSCCDQPAFCALNDLWEEANRALRDVFAGVTLAQLADRQRAKAESAVHMYNI